MNRWSNKRLGALATFIISLILLYIYFTPVINSLNTRIFSTGDGGDGLKAYYCYLYHIDHDSNSLHFEGMNYPYGESIFFTDNQPLLSEVVRIANSIIPGINQYSVGIWNGLLLLSIAFAAMVIFLILFELGVPLTLSIVAGIGISMLSPQIGRMGAHYSLSYVFVIPLAFYLLLKFSKEQKYRYSLAMAALTFWAGFTHMYFIAMLAMVIFLFWIFYLIVQPKVFAKWKTVLFHVMIQFILPLVLFQLLVSLSSEVSDRGSQPYGFFIYLSHPWSILFPANPQYGTFFAELIKEKKLEWEGLSYVGIIGALTVVVFVIKLLTQLVRARFTQAFQFGQALFPTFLFWSSFIILLYSFGIPFILGLEHWVDYLGPIKQMRSIGRFAWVFFYAMNILAFYGLAQFYLQQTKKLIPLLVIIVAAGILLFEGHLNYKFIKPYLKKESTEFTDSRHYKSTPDLLDNINSSDYQSILPLPYFHIGSENIWKRSACGTKEMAFNLSLQTGLPLHAVMMGRTSISQTYKSLELTWEPTNNPAIFNELPSDKKILIIAANCDQLTAGEEFILNHSTPLSSNEQFTIAEINPISWQFKHREYRKNLIQSHQSTNQHIHQSTDPPVHQSTGPLSLPYNTYGRIFRDTLANFSLPDEIVVSFWVENFTEDAMPTLQLETMILDQSDQCTKYILVPWGNYLKQLFDGWGLIEYTVPVQAGEKLSIVLFPGKIKHEIVVKDLLIRPAKQSVYMELDEKTRVLNNRLYLIDQWQ